MCAKRHFLGFTSPWQTEYIAASPARRSRVPNQLMRNWSEIHFLKLMTKLNNSRFTTAELDALEALIDKLKEQTNPAESAPPELARKIEDSRSQMPPWEDPDILATTKNPSSYSYRMPPEQYLKINWILQNVPGRQSMQTFIRKAVDAELKRVLEKVGAS